MENLLSSIVLSQKETKKAIDKQTDILERVLKIEEDRASTEKKRVNQEKRQKRHRARPEKITSTTPRRLFSCSLDPTPVEPGKKAKDGAACFLVAGQRTVGPS